MARVSILAASVAGFGLIKRRPLTVFAWGLFYILVGVVPMVFLLAPMLDFAGQMALHPQTPPTPQAMAALTSRMMVSNPLANLLSLAVKAVICGAVFRAILEPKSKGFASLRLGMQEVWIFLVTLVLFFIIVFGTVIAVGLDVLVASLLTSHVSPMAGHLGGIWLGLIIAVAAIWILLRLSLATPMSFAERGFHLFDSWSLTKGRGGALLLLAIILVVIALVLELIYFAVFGAIGFSFASAVAGPKIAAPEFWAAYLRQPPAHLLRAAAPYLVFASLAITLFIGVVQAVFLAPWASVYKMLKTAPTGPAVAVLNQM